MGIPKVALTLAFATLLAGCHSGVARHQYNDAHPVYSASSQAGTTWRVGTRQGYERSVTFGPGASAVMVSNTTFEGAQPMPADQLSRLLPATPSPPACRIELVGSPATEGRHRSGDCDASSRLATIVSYNRRGNQYIFALSNGRQIVATIID